MKKKLLFLLFSVVSFLATAQKTISGKVVDEQNEPLAGVSILVKGTTKGASTNSAGLYTLNEVSAGATLVFTFIGYETQEISAGNQTSINVSLQPSAESLDEIVVTALNQSVNKKSLGYSLQTLKSTDITDAGTQNLVGAMQGKIAGAVITGSGGDPGGGVNIILRGVTSLSAGADNQPLFVVDGIIISNATSMGTSMPSSGSNAYDASEQFSNTNRAADINPDDIESLSVLKGPAATALYGLRASNGAIIITTKRAKAGKLNISVGSSFGIANVGKSPSLQTTYLQGRSGEFVPVEGSRTPYQSLGPVLESENTTDRLYDNFRGFFRTGFTNNNNVTISKGGDKGNIYFSLGRSYNAGIVPNTDFERNSIKLAGTYNITSKFSASASFNYINSGGNRAPSGDKSIFSALAYWPNTYDVNDYLNADGTYKNILPGFTDNPRYLVERSPRVDKINRYIGDITLNYKINDWLAAKYQVTMDTFDERRTRQVDSTFDVGTSVRGFLIKDFLNYQEINSNLYLTATKKLSSDWSSSFMIGNSVVDSKRPDSFWERGEGHKAPFTDDMSSYRNFTTRPYSPLHYRIVSFFGDAKFSFRDYLFINVTGRNDIVSTLPKSNNSFFYPSVNVGYVFTENLNKNNTLSFGKLRASWAQVGKGTDPYVTGVYYDVTNNFPYGNTVDGFIRRSTTADPNLKPERTSSVELGTELRFMKDKYSLDLTWFSMDSRNQIVRAPVSNVSGYTHYYTNIGLIRNQGLELLASAKWVQTKNFSWDMSLNWSRLRGNVIEMPDELQEISYYDNVVGSLRVREGSRVGDLWGYDFRRNPAGDVIINATTGLPTIDMTLKQYGNALPDWTAGLVNSFTYKGLNLSALLEWRHGGDVIDLGDRLALRSGSIKLTERRYEQVVYKGVVETTSADGNVTYAPNEKVVYWNDAMYNPSAVASSRFNALDKVNIQDASWFRLRSVSIGYALPKKVIENTVFKNGVRFSFTGNNLFVNTPFRGYDPESLAFGSGSNLIGFVGRNTPATRSFQLGFVANF